MTNTLETIVHIEGKRSFTHHTHHLEEAISQGETPGYFFIRDVKMGSHYIAEASTVTGV